MKKSTAVALLCLSLVMILAGVVLGLRTGWGPATASSRSRDWQYDPLAVTSVRAETLDADIRIYESWEKTIRVETSDLISPDVEAELSAGALTVTQHESDGGFAAMLRQLFRRKETPYILIWIPKGMTGTLSLETAGGDVDVSSLRGDGLDLTASADSGNVSVYSSVLASADLRTVSGGVYTASNDYLGPVSVYTVSGDVNWMEQTSDGLSLSTVSGRVWFTNVRAEELSVEAVSGDVWFDDCLIGVLKAKTTSGDLTLWNTDADALEFETTSGDCDLELNGGPEDYTVSFETGSGRLSGRADGSGDKTIHVVSTSGDLRLEWED